MKGGVKDTTIESFKFYKSHQKTNNSVVIVLSATIITNEIYRVVTFFSI
jgi:hypothetical protein